MEPITVEDIITFLKDENFNFIGNRKEIINSVNNAKDAKVNQVTFVKYEDEKAKDLINESNASLIIASTKVTDLIDENKKKNILFVEKPRFFFVKFCDKFFQPVKKYKIDKSAVIGENCKIADDVFIGPHVSIGDNVEIDSKTVINAGVVIYDNVKIGKSCIIHAGTVIGADGFGYEREENGEVIKFPHYGGVVIEDNVEIGANTCIDRGTLKNTLIEKGAKIDNLCHIAHNTKIGKFSFIIAHCQIAGSTTIGENCWIAPGVSMLNGIKIGNNVMIGMGATVLKNVDDDTYIGAKGFPVKNKKN